MNATRQFVAAALAAVMSAAAYGQSTAPATEASTQAATKPAVAGAGPTINGTLTEWVVFVGDPFETEMNRKELAKSTLPPFVNELRESTSEKDAKKAQAEQGEGVLPVGVIRFTPAGAIDKVTTLDVALNYKAGRTLGTWPAAKVRSSGVLWQDLGVAESGTGASTTLPDGSWLAPLQGGTMLRSGSTVWPYLLYDVELTYPVGLQVTAGSGGKYTIVQPMDAAMHDLTLYKWDGAGHWATATLETVAKTPGSKLHPVEKPAPAANAAARRVRVIAGTQPAAAEAKKEEKPTTQPGGTEMTLGPASGTDETVMNPWKEKLAAMGVASGDQEVAAKILSRFALDKKRLTAVYRMDPAELEKIMPLEVVPQPTKVNRMALVVLTNIDPAIDTELDAQIAKLGSANWKEREEAMTTLAKMGAMAKNRLEVATKSPDTEIVYRAEQLLEALNPGAAPSE